MTDPIFIVGSGRSGTSLLRAILNAHPNIHLGQESALFMWRGRWPGLKAGAFEKAWKNTASGSLFKAEPVQVDPDAPSEHYIRAVLEARSARFSATRWGDKTPLHAMTMDKILACFPNAKFIAMSRHPVTTVASLRRMCWGTGTVLGDSFMVKKAREKIRETPGVLRLKLEELLQDPETQLRRVLEHIGEDWHPNLLEHEKGDYSADPRLPWLTTAEKPLTPWREPSVKLEPKEVRMIERINPPELDGYPRWTEPEGVREFGFFAAQLGALLSLGGTTFASGPSIKPNVASPAEQLSFLFTLNGSVPPPEGLLERLIAELEPT